jgi:hypothetical protein
MNSTRNKFLLLSVATGLAALSPARAAVPEPARLNLAGEWRFALDRSTEQRDNGAGTPTLTPGDGVTQEWFKPSATLTPELARGLWAGGPAAPATAPARAFDPDLNDGSTPAPAPRKQ